MKLNKLLLILLISACFSSFAQSNEKLPKNLIVNILIDANNKIYIEETLTKKVEIDQTIKKLVRNTTANKYEGVTYRIFADGSSRHGIIMDVDQLLLKAYQPIRTKTEKYLLDLKVNRLQYRYSLFYEHLELQK